MKLRTVIVTLEIHTGERLSDLRKDELWERALYHVLQEDAALEQVSVQVAQPPKAKKP